MTGDLNLGTSTNVVFEGSSADDYETTLTVTNPTADRTITLPNVTGTVVTTGDTGTVSSGMITDNTIVNDDISANAEIAVSKLANGTARQLLQTDSGGSGVEFTSNVDVPGTLDVTNGATFDSTVAVTGLLSANGKLAYPAGTAAAVSLYSGSDTDTGIYSPGSNQFGISTAGTSRIVVDSSGRVIIGSSVVQAHANMDDLQLGDGSGNRGLTISSGTSGFGTLAFGDSSDASGNDRYSGSIEYSHADNSMRFYADIGERLRIDSSGNVGIGTSSPAGKVHAQVNDSGNSPSLLYLENLGTGNDTGSTIFFRNRVGTAFTDCSIQGLGTGTNQSALVFSTEGGSGVTERMRIDSSGNVLVGTTTANGSMTVNMGTDKNISFSGGVSEVGSVPALQATNTAGSSLASMGFRGTDLRFATGSAERMRIASDGEVLCGGSANLGGFSVNSSTATGSKFSPLGQGIHFANQTGCLFLSRQGNDGLLVSLRQAGTEEGSISVSGSTVSYNGAHLSRWSQLPGGAERSEILRGSVLSNLDEMCEWAYEAQDAVLYTEDDDLPEGVSVGDIKTPAKDAGTEDNEQLNRMKVSDVEGDKNVAGVFQAWDDDDDTYTNDFYCAMTGDFVIRIAQGTTVARGDLLMSAGDGTAKPQDDDIVRSKTIAKVTSTTVSTTYSDGSYCVPCVLMAC